MCRIEYADDDGWCMKPPAPRKARKRTGHGETQDEAMRDLQRQIAAEIARRERVG